MAMNQYDGSIRINTKLDNVEFNKGTKNINKGISSMKGALTKLAAAAAAAFSTKMLLDFGKAAINVASDLEEVQNVVNVAYGDLANKIEEYSKSAINNLGMSELAYKQFASTFMVMGKSMGLAEENAFNMSIALTQLVGDMASFYNVSHDVANTALKSIYTGETETLKRYGIVMTEVNLKNFALAKGISKSIDEMTQAEKTQLRYLYVTEQLALAEGDFVRTQESWANQTRIVAERFKELQGIIGKDLIQSLTPSIKFVNKLLGSIIDLYTTTRSLFIEQESLAESAEEAVEAQEELADAIEDTANSAKKSLTGLDDLTILNQNLAESSNIEFDLGFNDTSDKEIGEDLKVSDNVQKVADKIKSTIDYIAELFNGIEPQLKMLNDSFSIIIKDIGESSKKFIDDYISPMIPEIVEIIGSIIETLSSLSPYIDTALGVIGTLFNELGKIFLGIQPYIDSALNLISELLINVGEIFEELAPKINEIISSIFEIIGPLIAKFNEAFLEIAGAVKPLLDALKPIIDIILDLILLLTNELIEGINDLNLQPLIDIFLDLINVLTDIITFIGDLGQGIKSLFEGDFKEAGEIFGDIWDGIVQILKLDINKIIEFLNGLINALNSAINNIVNSINSILSFPLFGTQSKVGQILGNTGGRIPNISIPNIPYLAKGAVIPPNSEFMAVLGDQKTGRNIETPESLLRQIMREENNNDEVISLLVELIQVVREKNLDIDGRKLARQLRPYQKELDLVKGGR